MSTSVLDYGADLVVIATGSHWATDGLNGFAHDVIPGADASLAHVLTPEQIMLEGKEPPGGRVVVYDCDGYFIAASLAERLARGGYAVTYVTPMAELAPYMVYTLEAPRMNRLARELGIEVVPHHLVTRIEPGTVEGQYVHDESPTTSWSADAIVLCTQRVSDDRLYRALEARPEDLRAAGISGLYRIGDCVVPRIAAEAVFDGHRLAREIDAEDPATPLAVHSRAPRARPQRRATTTRSSAAVLSSAVDTQRFSPA